MNSVSLIFESEILMFKEIKVENAFFVFSALSHVFPFIFFNDIYITVCDYQLSI